MSRISRAACAMRAKNGEPEGSISSSRSARW